MHVLMALLGGIVGAWMALLGVALGDGRMVFFGLLIGAFLGWQQSRLAQIRKRLNALETRARAERFRKPSAEATPPAQKPAVASSTPFEQDAVPSPEPPSDGVVTPRGTSVAKVDEAVPSVAATPSTPVAASVETIPTTWASPQAPGHSTTIPAAAYEPSGPNALERLFERGREWLFGGNVPVKIGVLVLLFGVAAALKYSVDAGWLNAPISLRLALIAAAGLAAIVWGWRNRDTRSAFGLSLQGGGIGVLLLTVFAAYRLYHLLPSGIAFGLVLVLVAGAAALAVLQNAMALAVLGFLGGYLAPVLLSTDEGSHVALFSFYALLNLAVFVIAWFRHWRVLNLIGFFFTFAIGLSWGAEYYRPQHFATVEPFLILFFLFYVAIVVLHALRTPSGRRDVIDGTLLFGTPLLAFSLQAAMLHEQPLALAWSAMVMAVLYALLAAWMLRSRGIVLLGQSFGVLALGFATLAVPLVFSARWTCAIWALEGAALVWLGLRQSRLLPQVAGITLQGLAAISYVTSLIYDGGWRAAPGEWLLLNGHALCVLLLSGSAFAVSWLYERAGKNRLWVWPGFLLGMAWWGLAGLREIWQNVAPLLLNKTTLFTVSGWVGFAALTLLVMSVLRRALDWPRMGWAVLMTLTMSLPLALASQPQALSALHWPLSVFWLVWAAAAIFALQNLRQPWQRGLGFGHILLLATLSLVYGLALNLVARDAGFGADWVFVVTFLPQIALLLLTARMPAIGAFPLADEFAGHAKLWFVLAAVVLVAAGVNSLRLSGDTAPLPYMPVLNPAELFQLIGLIAIARWAWTQTNAAQWAPWLTAAGVVFLSVAGLRAVHHYAGLPWSPELLNHGSAQATLTVLWSLLGVGAWIMGSRRQLWGLWLVGAIALGAVLVKLALVDRQYVGNLAGIVSFIAVGGLLVLVGRIAPTPPRQDGSVQEGSS